MKYNSTDLCVHLRLYPRYNVSKIRRIKGLKILIQNSIKVILASFFIIKSFISIDVLIIQPLWISDEIDSINIEHNILSYFLEFYIYTTPIRIFLESMKLKRFLQIRIHECTTIYLQHLFTNKDRNIDGTTTASCIQVG